MSGNKVFDFDVANNTVNVREMNEEELTNLEVMKAAKMAQDQSESDLASKKQTALVKLEALGLNEDDLKALGF